MENNKLSESSIKLIVDSITKELKRKEEEHKLALEVVRNLCSHSEIENAPLGCRICSNCGKVFPK